MKKMNLLLVQKEGRALGGTCQKLVSKVFRKGLVLQLHDIAELDGIVSRLSINCLLLDVDDSGISMEDVQRRHPQLAIYGFSRRLNAKQGKVFSAKNFEQDFLLEMKDLRKANSKHSNGLNFSLSGVFAANFKDFGRLLAAKA